MTTLPIKHQLTLAGLITIAYHSSPKTHSLLDKIIDTFIDNSIRKHYKTIIQKAGSGFCCNSCCKMSRNAVTRILRETILIIETKEEFDVLKECVTELTAMSFEDRAKQSGKTKDEIRREVEQYPDKDTFVVDSLVNDFLTRKMSNFIRKQLPESMQKAIDNPMSLFQQGEIGIHGFTLPEGITESTIFEAMAKIVKYKKCNLDDTVAMLSDKVVDGSYFEEQYWNKQVQVDEDTMDIYFVDGDEEDRKDFDHHLCNKKPDGKEDYHDFFEKEDVILEE